MPTLDITPSWAALMPALIAALQDGTDEGKRIAKAELMRLAAQLDARNASKDTHSQKVTVRPDGNANFFHLLHEGDWLAVVQLNGWIHHAKQAEIMQQIADNFPQLPERT